MFFPVIADQKHKPKHYSRLEAFPNFIFTSINIVIITVRVVNMQFKNNAYFNIIKKIKTIWVDRLNNLLASKLARFWDNKCIDLM